jgi:hypothetical protein
MKEIMEEPQLSVVEKSKLYSDQLNRFLTFKNKDGSFFPWNSRNLCSKYPTSACRDATTQLIC